MSTISAIYLLSPGISGFVLKSAMWSNWSHVAPLVPDGNGGLYVIDATFMHGGVRERALPDVMKGAKDFEIRDFACPNPQAAYEWARSQLGKPYDVWGVLGIGFHRDWQEDDAWFCSEFFEAMLAAGGNQRFIDRVKKRITVEHSYMVAR